ncbi:MAG: glycosyltransferase family 2 protein [Candidatus Thiodiazotropha sp. (ex Lucinoma borealis)]|nr:glycosyltransferase family 2 protein [Candidatus Thiodiazotropha sp. (ex Lucinoma borealis)]
MISVIIPTYKRKQMLVRALSSLEQQTYKEIEIIVIDDDSDRSVEKIVNNINNTHIRYLRSPNIGGAGARNVGIKEARGEFIAFLDDDDYYHCDKLLLQLRQLKKTSTDVVLCGSYNLTTKKEQVLAEDHDIEFALRMGNPYQINLLVRSEVIKVNKFDEDLPNGQDWDILVRLIKAGVKLSYIAKPLVYRDDGDHYRITNSIIYKDSQTQKRLTAINKHRAWLKEKYFKYRCAKEELAYISKRKEKLFVILNVLRKYGIKAIAYVIVARMLRYV